MSGRIILVRHGQTSSNIERFMDTKPPGAELTPRGREQAADVGAELAGVVGAGDGSAGRLKGVVCSVALRAQQTAMLLREALEREARLPERSLPVDVVVGIHEVFAGELEMQNSEDAHREYSTALRGWLAGDADARMPGGESYVDVVERGRPVLEEIAAGLGDDEDVIVVSHGAAIRMLTKYAANVDSDFAFTGYLANCRFTVLEPGGKPYGEWTLKRWADTEI